METLVPSLSGADLLVLHGLGEFLIALGLVGVVSMLFNDRRIQRRLLGLLFVVVAAGGVALTWRMDQLLVADRDLTPAQQAALSKAIGQFRDIEFVVQALPDDREAQSLARKVVLAIKAGIGTTPQFVDEAAPDLPPGVVLLFAPKDTALRRNLSDAVGTKLAAARIAVITDATEQPEQVVRIVVGRKP